MRNYIKIFLLSTLCCLLSDAYASRPAKKSCVAASSGQKIEYKAFLIEGDGIAIGAYKDLLDADEDHIGKIEYFYAYALADGNPYISDLEVNKQWRGKGIAKQLLAYALADIRAHVPGKDILLDAMEPAEPKLYGDTPDQLPLSLGELIKFYEKHGAIKDDNDRCIVKEFMSMKFPAKRINQIKLLLL